MLTLLRSSYFTEFLESLTAGTLIVNSSGAVYAGNGQAAALLGMDLPGLMGSDASALAGRLSPSGEFLAALEEAKRRKTREKPLYAAYSRPDGRTAHLTVSVSLLVEYDKLFGILLQFQDVTEMVDLHEREKRALTERAAIQRERIASLRNFSMAVAHQIRNPLMCIGGFSRRLLNNAPPEGTSRPALEAIVESADRLSAVVAAVSDYARPAAAEPQETNLRALTARTIEEALANGAAKKSVDLRRHVPEGTFRFAPEPVSRALREAVLNALEAVPERGGRITARGFVEKGALVLEIADNGPGVAEDVLPFVFDPFFTTKAVGVGMGLAMARQCAEALHGSIALVNGPAGGAVTVIRFPCVPGGGPSDLSSE